MVLVADCVTKSFGDHRVLSAGSLRAVAGEVRVIFGRNGIGKSTLMKIAAGWMQPDSGVVHLRRQALLHASLPRLARAGIFFLPDQSLFSDAWSIGRQLQFFARRFGGPSIAECAERTGVAHVLSRRPYEVSGGELRRAELAAVLARRPDCLLADEPYRGIAPVDHEVLTGVFRSMARDGCAIVVSGHEVPTLLDAADHITWCTAGTTYELGAPTLAREHEAFVRDYLGPHLMRVRT